MTFKLARVTGLAALLLVGSAAAAAETDASPRPRLDPASASVDQINACSRANLADRGSLRDVTLKSKGRDGKERTLKLKLFWKPAKGTGEGRLNARVVEPKDLAGTSYLLIEGADAEKLYFYLPAADKVQEVSGDDLTRPLWGTDLSYNDLKQLQGLAASGATTRAKDAVVGKRKTYVLETALKEQTPQYSKLRSFVDQESCVPLKSEFLSKDGKVVKQLDAAVGTLSQLDPYWFVTAYTMKDLARKSETSIDLSDVYLLESLSEKTFEPASFYQKNE